MIRVVINKCHGGFGLSTDATMHLINTGSELVIPAPLMEYTGEATMADAIKNLNRFGGIADKRYLGEDFCVGTYGEVFNPKLGLVYQIGCKDGLMSFRAHPDLIAVVEAMGRTAAGAYARLEIVEIPDEDITLDNLDIDEYDGVEWVSEKHRTWS